jgi:hypothetical protein
VGRRPGAPYLERVEPTVARMATVNRSEDRERFSATRSLPSGAFELVSK